MSFFITLSIFNCQLLLSVNAFVVLFSENKYNNRKFLLNTETFEFMTKFENLINLKMNLRAHSIQQRKSLN